MVLSVALFTRAWIEIATFTKNGRTDEVALFTRAWIEIRPALIGGREYLVALFTRAWIEMPPIAKYPRSSYGRPLHEGVD